ncbi:MULTISPECIES: TetR/AcrR family transcriptional regulator [Bifidobacterium]|jgi:AcrR family transcriptional regulator|uniref:TetR/AcrR family transcriptional regulator n=1 Tax=Bifidobacterium tibiigranuli TaxID=2172043 RepID=A0A5N6SAC7_9BIFI|nr:TetR/AcrR family transcriptional regulator [Bifidobacterium tibiigranuli]KAE8130031.1 TetR/AcrR family transcriptional regulator [Bifidobacterium tibiigranuli]KAE8130611.1 hypothetical protein DDF78_01615 [Bifidobacterium tibiigranuli]MCH3974525.1 TetR/AcrR family transcriptional regulator [Bifidobacterium tibiigranuli]MCH4189443.1 TetR/AcrR family transcriptional regulator [Bifidobacterium tibiigranuli]MCH4204266.1 TetR/AcrR family transcriptional regulator [Bifidobacterium tibiigranuli]
MSRSLDPQRRVALLHAGQQVLASKGAGKATIDDITQTAGVAKGTFYLYFSSKADLIKALRADFAGQIGNALREHMEGNAHRDWQAEARNLLRLAVDEYLQIAPSYSAVLDCASSEADDTSWERSITAVIADFLQAAKAQHACAVEDSEVAAVFLFHGINGVCHHALHAASGTSDDSADAWDSERVAAAIEPFVVALFRDERR